MVSAFAIPVGPMNDHLAAGVAGHCAGFLGVGAELQPDSGADWEGWM
jgi:hypothetical protein